MKPLVDVDVEVAAIADGLALNDFFFDISSHLSTIFDFIGFQSLCG
jgi:hypothetical protein